MDFRLAINSANWAIAVDKSLNWLKTRNNFMSKCVVIKKMLNRDGGFEQIYFTFSFAKYSFCAQKLLREKPDRTLICHI
ncbi:MAG: hypothetical protein DRR16_21835 [Candidatus Parabeggiatoa sp. nov. 3]|nr:MAG: hypothetical protein DRR00_00175 [Gammaproteobacteria bacterium]RKZ69568.1 MAG: hypothetical protein DRQ99_00610 [Gammaproteobacteria bacterium]RKZ81579.1 MAG: hypothetical protein DRR16_21835 [Gammaproteobacteria bacterium]